jgi:hypothetical protein
VLPSTGVPTNRLKSMESVTVYFKNFITLSKISVIRLLACFDSSLVLKLLMFVEIGSTFWTWNRLHGRGGSLRNQYRLDMPYNN